MDELGMSEWVEGPEEWNVYGHRLEKNKLREVEISHIMPFYSINKNRLILMIRAY